MAKLDTYQSSNITTGNTLVVNNEINIALGNVNGLSFLVVSGRNPDIDTGSTPEDIWLGGGEYGGFDVTSAETLDVVSTSALDTGGGTGAQTLEIFGLDSGYNEITEIINLSGTTTVTTTNSFLRVNRAIVNTAGSTSVNQGQINISQSVSTTIMGVVGSLIGNTLQALYTVPLGKTLYLKNVSLTLNDRNATNADTLLQVRPFGKSWLSSAPFGISQTGGQVITPLTYSVKIEERSDIRFRVDNTSSNNTDITSILEFLLSE